MANIFWCCGEEIRLHLDICRGEAVPGKLCGYGVAARDQDHAIDAGGYCWRSIWPGRCYRLSRSMPLSLHSDAVYLLPISLYCRCTAHGDDSHMTYTIIILSKAQKYFDTLDEQTIFSIWSNAAELKENPYHSRPLADIKKLRGFRSPPMYRLRVGRHRLEYFIDEGNKTITVTNAFRRSGDSDYR